MRSPHGDHEAPVVAARPPKIIVVLTRDSRRQTVARPVEIERAGIAVGVGIDGRVFANGRGQCGIYAGDLARQTLPTELFGENRLNEMCVLATSRQSQR